MNNYILLSHELSDSLSAYGNGKRISVNTLHSMKNGDSSNNTSIELPSHYGTHIDLPRHFLENGKTLSSYNISNFISEKIQIIDARFYSPHNFLIKEDLLKDQAPSDTIDVVLIYFDYSSQRGSEKYWKYNPGFSFSFAEQLKLKYPNIKIFGFDLMSLSSYQQREIGRDAHKVFLSNDIIILEDMNMACFDKVIPLLKRIIVAPLMVKGAEGAPVTVIGEY